MKKIFTALRYFVIAAAAALLALYSLGILGGEKPRSVQNKAYPQNGFVFTGTLLGGRFHGTGEVTFFDGKSYHGGFEAGRFEGSGIFDSAGAWRFEGDFAGGGMKDGIFYFKDAGTLAFSNDGNVGALVSQGWRYDGDFGERGQYGFGMFTFDDGSVYRGSFQRGFANGYGAYTNADGIEIYNGGFQDGLFSGQGRYISPDGQFTYEGGFKDGLFNGIGEMTKDDGQFSGEWEKGVLIRRDE